VATDRLIGRRAGRWWSDWTVRRPDGPPSAAAPRRQPAGPPGPAHGWDAPSRGESRWPATAAVLIALAIQLALPGRLTLGPRYLVPGLAAALLLPLAIGNPSRLSHESRDLRVISLALIGLLGCANTYALALLVKLLLAGGTTAGRQLIYAAVGIWLTNIVVFGLAYWELDRGGPSGRARCDHPPPDFLFPQMSIPQLGDRPWFPGFVDYLYVALTNGTAFSPTDAMPLTQRTKLLMGLQSVVSLITLALVAARAVNILS
jgi:hypothetical protein